MRLSVCVLATIVSLATADRRDIMVSEGRSWITDENLTTIVKLSFPRSKCCNVYISDPEENSAPVFGQFRDIYRYDYSLKTSLDECNGYFFFGSNDDQIAASISNLSPLRWTTEILVIVDNEVSTDSRLFNGSMYGHADVNIVSATGPWRLSESYLTPRLFRKLDRYEEMRRDRRDDFQGRELQVCSIYRPPMTYLNHTARRMIDGVEAETFLMDAESDWDGAEMRLFLIMAQELNFTWTVRKPEGNYTYGSRINETVWRGGMIQMLHDRKVDMAFASIWLTLDKSTFVHLTESWYQVDIHFLVPRPRRTTSFWALGRPFSDGIWLLLLTVLFLHSLYTYVRAWINPKFPRQSRDFLVTLIDLIGCLLSSSVPKTIAANKLQILLWRTAGWLIITAYCSSLAARLARSEYEDRIDTMEQFLEANLTWGSRQRPPFGEYFDLTDPLSAQLPRRFRFIEDDAQLERLIALGDHAILGKIIETCFYPDEPVSNDHLKRYRLMKQSLAHFHVAFAAQPWLLRPLNKIMRRLKEVGIAIWHLRDVIRRRDSYNLRQVLAEHEGHDGSVQVLGLTPLGAGFSLLLAGSTVAAIVFYSEVKRAGGPASSRSVLRDIGERRESRPFGVSLAARQRRSSCRSRNVSQLRTLANKRELRALD